MLKSVLIGSLSVITLATATTVWPQINANPAAQAVEMKAMPHPRMGKFVTVEQDHATTGSAKIVMMNGQRYLEFDEAFDTARGPLVKVVLHRDPTVPVNLAEGSYLTLAPLSSFTGAQRYLIPENIDLDTFNAVAIWCEEFNVTFGYAPLS